MGLLCDLLVIQSVLGLLAPLLILLWVHPMVVAAGGGKTFSAKYAYSACCQLFLTIAGDCFIRDAESVIQHDKSNLEGGCDAALFTS
jgi:hypothetical protein